MSINRTIFSHFFSGTLFIGIARAFTIIFGLVSVMIVTRYLTTEVYGAYVLLIISNSFLVEFLSFGLSLVIPKYLASNEDLQYKSVLLNTVFHFRIFIIFIVVLITVLLKPFFISFFKSSLSSDIVSALPILFCAISLMHLFDSILRGQFRFKYVGLIEFVSEATELTLLAVLVIVYDMGFWGLIIAKFAARIISITIAYNVSQFKYKWELNIRLLKDMLSFGFPLQLQYIFGFAYSKLDTIIIGSLLGAKGVAYYDIAKKIPDSLMQLYSVFISVYFPISANIYATEKKEKTDFVMNNSIRLLAFLAVFAALGSVLFGKEIIILLFSKEYLASYWVLILLMIGMVLNVLESTLGYSLIAIGESDKPLYVNIVRAVVSITGNLTILPILGYIGAAIANILGNLIAIPINVFFLKRKKLSPNFSAVLKLTFVFVFLLSLFFVLGQNNIFVKVFLAILFFPLSILLSIITIRDVVIVFEETRTILTDTLKKFRGEQEKEVVS